MYVLSVNIGQEQSIRYAKASGKTGIYKKPVATAVEVKALGLANDSICDSKNHGGVDQAVYIYGQADYDWWSGILGKALEPGTFGENLTISNLESAKCRIGDRFLIAELVLEVSAPRIPCVTLATRMEDPNFVKRFKEAERPGLYCRVIRPGSVKAGDEVRLEPYSGQTLGVIEMFRDFYKAELSEQELRRYLAAPIAIRDRVEKEARLAKLLK